MLTVKTNSPRPILRMLGLAAEEPAQSYLRERVRLSWANSFAISEVWRSA